jgi:hypothetical protein
MKKPEVNPAAWLVLACRLPAGHSPVRARVRRKLTAAGAVYPAGSVVLLPASPEAEKLCRRVRKVIADAGGAAVFLAGEALAGEADITAAFNAARDQEYQQVTTACDAITSTIQDLTAAGQLSFPDLAGQEAELKKLSVRTGTISFRDTFGAAGHGQALAALTRCQAELDFYSEQVCKADDTEV